MKLVDFEINNKISIRIHGIQQWSWVKNILTKVDMYNWVDLDFIKISIESGDYKGRYFELTLVILGVGFWMEVYDKPTRTERVNELLSQIPDILE